MIVSFDDRIFLHDWMYKGCTAKVLMYLIACAKKNGENEVHVSRKSVCTILGESDWSVRSAIKNLVEHKIILQLSSSSGAMSKYSISATYIKIENRSLQLSSSLTRKKGKTSPASLQLSSNSNESIKDCKSKDCELSGEGNSPASLQLSSSLTEKETKKKKSPIPPIKKIKKKEDVLTDSSQLLPNGKVEFNKRARKVFEKTYLALYGTTYYWTAKDAGQMTILLNAIKFSRQNRASPLPNDVDSVMDALQKFLLSINKTWINDNFSVAMIASHYNEIISELKNKRNNGKTMHGFDDAAVSRRAEILSNVASYDEKWQRENGSGNENR